MTTAPAPCLRPAHPCVVTARPPPGALCCRPTPRPGPMRGTAGPGRPTRPLCTERPCPPGDPWPQRRACPGLGQCLQVVESRAGWEAPSQVVGLLRSEPGSPRFTWCRCQPHRYHSRRSWFSDRDGNTALHCSTSAVIKSILFLQFKWTSGSYFTNPSRTLHTGTGTVCHRNGHSTQSDPNLG